MSEKMRFRLDTIPEEGKDVEATISPAQIMVDMPGYMLNRPLVFSGRLTRSAQNVYVHGKLTGTVNAQCGRCLEDFELPVDLEVDIAFSPEREQLDQDVEVHEYDANLAYYEADSIDLLPELRDLFLVDLPIRPVCRSDCKGLCSQCGVDLNVDSCTCGIQAESSPFDKLKELKLKMEEQE